MQHQTLPDQYRVAFDLNSGIESLTFPAGTDVEVVTARIDEAFLAADLTDNGHVVVVTLDIDAGTVVVSADGDVIEHGSITRVDEQLPAKPDYWLTLADAVRQHADRIATLAGTDWTPSYVGLSIRVAGPGNTDPIAGDKADVIADVFGLTAETGRTSSGQYYERRATGKLHGLNFVVYSYVPAPPEMDDPEKATLRAELETLRAQLAEGGDR